MTINQFKIPETLTRNMRGFKKHEILLMYDPL